MPARFEYDSTTRGNGVLRPGGQLRLGSAVFMLTQEPRNADPYGLLTIKNGSKSQVLAELRLAEGNDRQEIPVSYIVGNNLIEGKVIVTRK